MKVVVTTGPAFEPIDQVRRITNFSTGELGVLLSCELAKKNFDVFCFKGAGATYPGPGAPCIVHPFTTNDDLFDQLTLLSARHRIAAVFHVAALCDYKIKQVEDSHGRKRSPAKYDSRAGNLVLVLEPARKLIGSLRTLFPKAVIVGWKYEPAGTRHEALAKAWAQLRENNTDACVLNGAGYGNGFAFCVPPDQVVELPEKSAVARFLADWLHQRRNA